MPAVTDPGPNTADEPLGSFSVARAAQFLDNASLHWQEQRKCMTCHTNYLYLLARPQMPTRSPAEAAVRTFAEQIVTERWPDKGPRWDAEVVMTAAVLASHDAATTGKLHPTTRLALDRMWEVQRADGGFDWISCNWPPMESDEHFGATMAALAAGWAPEGYAREAAVVANLDKLRAYFREHPPTMLHHRAMLLWASAKVDGILTADEQQAVLDELLALQRPDGGWVFASLGNWDRSDSSPQDLEHSDGYATGLVVYLARVAGVAANDPRLVRGVDWLRQNQRASGRWFTRSAWADGKHYITHAGTAMAVMALAACNALDPAPEGTASAATN
ncbi:MAG: squalene--hopene cyclase [Pirellulales bacterium]|nr:squalene--hopene cyclase [Pirellulales bacterium]